VLVVGKIDQAVGVWGYCAPHMYNLLVAVGATLLNTPRRIMWFQIRVVINAAIAAVAGMSKAWCIDWRGGRSGKALVWVSGSVMSFCVSTVWKDIMPRCCERWHMGLDH